MTRSSLLVTVFALICAVGRADDTPAKLQPYPIKIDVSDMREFSKLEIDFAKLKLQGESIVVVPISIETAATGAVLIGNGTFSYTPEGGKNFAGRFRTALLRFNPKDADSIIKLSTGKSTLDKGAGALSELLIADTFRHCYHSGKDALIPPEHAIAADLFSQELGDVLISIADTTAAVYNFTDRSMLYEKK